MLQCSGLLHRRQIDGHGAEFGFVVAVGVGVGVGWMFEFWGCRGCCWRGSMAMGLSLGLGCRGCGCFELVLDV
uniref:Transmembrane protein n=1 Tax=Fagus sylvatica TaxID=28930 RepID=A0A2N9EWH8_FAGSY